MKTTTMTNICLALATFLTAVSANAVPVIYETYSWVSLSGEPSSGGWLVDLASFAAGQRTTADNHISFAYAEFHQHEAFHSSFTLSADRSLLLINPGGGCMNDGAITSFATDADGIESWVGGLQVAGRPNSFGAYSGTGFFLHDGDALPASILARIPENGNSLLLLAMGCAVLIARRHWALAA